MKQKVILLILTIGLNGCTTTQSHQNDSFCGLGVMFNTQQPILGIITDKASQGDLSAIDLSNKLFENDISYKKLCKNI